MNFTCAIECSNDNLGAWSNSGLSSVPQVGKKGHLEFPSYGFNFSEYSQENKI